MTVIGLTGPSGAGKTLLCRAAESMGCETINADEVYHALLVPPSECLNEIVSAFGNVLSDDGALDRKKLGSIVFSDPQKLALLNSVTHKYVTEKFRAIIAEMKERCVKTVIIDAPTLFESGFDKECDATVCLLASESVRRERIIARDDLDQDRASARLSSQKKDDFFISRAAFVIYNEGSEAELKAKLAELLSKIDEDSVTQ